VEPKQKGKIMNVLLWILQALVAFMAGAGSLWRIFNYATQAKTIPSVQALSAGTWTVIGIFEIACALLLVLPGLFKWHANLTPIAASALAVEMVLITALHAKYFGLRFSAENPAIWTLGLAIAAAFIAYGRFVARPL
jgi:hypothetical protein